MNNRVLKLFVEIGYIVMMTIFLLLTTYHKLDSGHYIILYFFNVFCMQLMEMLESRMNNFLIYKFGISSLLLLFVCFTYLQDVDSYFAHILLLIMVLLLLSNWHFILDNKIYRTYNIIISTVVTIYSLVGYIIFSSKNEWIEWYLFLSVLVIMFTPIIYFIIHYRRITNYMEYKKNIMIFLIVSWLFSGVLYIKMGLFDSRYSTVMLFLVISCFQYAIQNIFLSYYSIIVFRIKSYLMSLAIIGIFILLTNFYYLQILLLLIVNLVYVITDHTKFGVHSKDKIKNTYLMRISHLSNELKYNKDMANYLHDSILQDVIYLKKSVDDENVSKEEVSMILSNIINDLRLKLDNLAPSIYLDKSLYENLCLNIEQIKNRHFDKRIVLDLFCDEKAYLENPYDELLLRVVKELINNIYKHTESNFAEIKICIEKSILSIEAFNDEGFLDENLLYENNRFSGLIGIYKTVQMIGGKIMVDNSEGVNIIINIPLKGGDIIEDSINRRS
ncbi:hypothetical protein [Streptococcus ovuberis]|uniref:Uncharacterized protein n=1 Tax=Streptococcus ovuberis TaxID=1936207 RepID=A0A7X6MZQ0_9STRE|nr:hypothetical protein [Streptococcus ovuberis]NKZ20826.1 hypothetical protein [Streptococcus ovuberis]